MNQQLKRIKLFTYYGCSELNMQRKSSPAGDSKIDYIVKVLNRLGYGVDIVSQAASAENHCLSAYTETRGDNTYRYFASLRNTNSFIKIINRLLLRYQLFFWCLSNLVKNEQVIVYHSSGYDSSFIRLKKIKKIKIIGEIEEIYQDVRTTSKRNSKNEYKFISICDKYIFPTQLLDKKVNIQNKPSIIIHGVYSVEPMVADKFADGKIHVVYGGTLDPAKGGGFAAAAAEFLPENYHIHICGFGDKKQIISIINNIQKKSKALITFEGELKGDEYKKFIQKCHIGLSTQNPDASFNSTSFPSKILVYLSNGLKVVSVRIPAIELSAVSNNLVFYDKQTPQDIAVAIMNASFTKQNGSNLLHTLDWKFTEDLLSLIGGECHRVGDEGRQA